MIEIHSTLTKLNIKQGIYFRQDEIKNEPMLFNCDYKSAIELGGPITKEVLRQLDANHDFHKILENCVIDTRVHMLMKGWYPCIPGWHHDDVPRERGDGQPEYINPSYRSKHVMLLMNDSPGDISSTEFAIGKCNLEIPKGIIYETWNRDVDTLINHDILKKVTVEDNQWYFFDDRSFHRGVAAIRNGWRYFIRVSWDTKRKATNEVRRQVQVYLDNVNQGW